MRNHKRLFFSAASSIIVSGTTFACVGGGGTAQGDLTTWDPAVSTYEGAGTTQERGSGAAEPAAGSSSEAASGDGQRGAGGFDCSGTYICAEPGDDDRDSVTLSTVGGVCSAGSGNSMVVLGSQGTVTRNGRVLGTWQATGSGFTFTTSEGSITCVKASSATGSGSSMTTIVSNLA